MFRYWVLLSIAVFAILWLAVSGFFSFSPEYADAQVPELTGSSDIRTVPVRIGRESYGIAMVDTTAQTIWLYRINNRGPSHKRLELIAARTWKYDKLLEEFNSADPSPEQVKILLQGLKTSETEPNEPNNTSKK